MSSHCAHCKGLHAPAPRQPGRNMHLEAFLAKWARDNGYSKPKYERPRNIARLNRA